MKKKAAALVSAFVLLFTTSCSSSSGGGLLSKKQPQIIYIVENWDGEKADADYMMHHTEKDIYQLTVRYYSSEFSNQNEETSSMKMYNPNGVIEYSARGNVYSYRMCAVTSGTFGPNKGDEFFKKFESYKLEKYEPYHESETGQMITEYKPYSVAVSYEVFDSNGNLTRNIDDSGISTPPNSLNSAAKHEYYTMSEEDYSQLLADFKELRSIAESSNQ